MTDNNIEKSIAEAVERMTPDILDDLIKELDIPEEPPRTLAKALSESEPERETVRKTGSGKQWRKAIVSCAAALVLVVSGAFLWGSKSSEAFAVVGLDVNPSIEIDIDKKERVVSATAINDDGKDIIGDMDLKGTDVEVACNAIVGAMLTKGYLTNTSNALLVSVNAKDEVKGKEIEQRISDNLNSYIGESEVDPAILGQYVDSNDEVELFAEENGISVGKAWLITNLLKTGSTKMTQESLLNLSTQDLILLGQKRNVVSDVSYGEADTSEFIGNEKALSIALENSGLTEDQITGQNIEFDCEEQGIVYEVDFHAGGLEYEYDINAKTGEILFSESEKDDDDWDDDDDDWDDDDDDRDFDDDDDDD